MEGPCSWFEAPWEEIRPAPLRASSCPFTSDILLRTSAIWAFSLIRTPESGADRRTAWGRRSRSLREGTAAAVNQKQLMSHESCQLYSHFRERVHVHNSHVHFDHISDTLALEERGRGTGCIPHSDSTWLRSFRSSSWMRMTGSISRKLAELAPVPRLEPRAPAPEPPAQQWETVSTDCVRLALCSYNQ